MRDMEQVNGVGMGGGTVEEGFKEELHREVTFQEKPVSSERGSQAKI